MSWYLINLKEAGTPSIQRVYSERRGAFVGMRAANRNAGWTRISRCFGGIADTEWCAKSNGLPVYDYAPYAVVHSQHYAAKYSNKDPLVDKVFA